MNYQGGAPQFSKASSEDAARINVGALGLLSRGCQRCQMWSSPIGMMRRATRHLQAVKRTQRPMPGRPRAPIRSARFQRWREVNRMATLRIRARAKRRRMQPHGISRSRPSQVLHLRSVHSAERSTRSTRRPAIVCTPQSYPHCTCKPTHALVPQSREPNFELIFVIVTRVGAYVLLVSCFCTVGQRAASIELVVVPLG